MNRQLRKFLLRLTSRKFLVSLGVIIACTCVVFKPERVETVRTVIVQIASLVVMLLAAVGYSWVEASVDKKHKPQEGQNHDRTNDS